MTLPHGERNRPGPKPGSKRASAAPNTKVDVALVPKPPSSGEQITMAENKGTRDPLQRSRDIRSMFGDDLKAYAKQIGVRPRDIEELTEERLRQNCMLVVASLIEHLTE